ncbi:teichoic acid ABC transporter ATP-binding protein [Paenibacillus albilobatus]|uniref:Teichoic acid ABC transporter ATP-binding protein n=1 Tax=Paenibacillus albilobatus TaxID=2716884 RepID=A0A919XPC1_9BACL|nr:ABC transporter ATP-binding protein [Paenibacillus albilobatus]GIO35108.1 teichoic acid ABC transporter ATP-binding protein [Paenibacillus albilobatus]
MSENAVEVINVSMRFNLERERVNSLKEYIIKLLRKKIDYEEFFALKDVSFKIVKGDSFAIVGNNGSGKSTILKIISGIFKPTAGQVILNGSIAPLIELGAGFDMELTAKENVFLNGAVLGYSKKFMHQKYKDIIEFAELYDFEDVPLKNFSSGMVARLGFSIATVVRPDVLIVDEILSVGDQGFQEKCEKRLNEMTSNGTTLILVSHSIEQVKKICKNAIWLENGKLMASGPVPEVCEAYARG